MMTLKTHRRMDRAQGFSLLELLLALVVLATLMLGIMSLLQSYTQREQARSMNKYMLTVLNATKALLSDPDVYDALYEATLDAGSGGGGYELLADSVSGAANNIMTTMNVAYEVGGVNHTLAVEKSRLLDPNFRFNSPMRSEVRILLRIADDPATENDIRAMEVYVVTSRPVLTEVAQKAANEGEMHGGYIGTLNGSNFTAGFTNPGAATTTMMGAFRNWRLSMDATSRLRDTDWWAAFNAGGAVNPNTNGTYLVYYDYLNKGDIESDYLYRTPDPSFKRNTMYGALNMGGNDIVGADDVAIGGGAGFTAADIAATGMSTDCQGNVLCVEGSAIVKGSAAVNNRMVVNGSVNVADTANVNAMEIRNGLAADNGTDTTPRAQFKAKGLFVVDSNGAGGAGGVDSVIIRGNGTFNEGVSSIEGELGDVTGTRLAMPQGARLQTPAMDAGKVSATTINTNTLTVGSTGVLNVGNLSNTDLTIANGKVAGVVNTTDIDTFQYGEIGGLKSISAPVVRVENLNISRFGRCDFNCKN